MPIYYFTVRGAGIDMPDLTGRLCADEAEARAEAERLAAELAETARAAGVPAPAATIEVDDEALRPVLAIPLLAIPTGAPRC